MGTIFSFINGCFSLVAWVTFIVSLVYILTFSKRAKERGTQKEVTVYLPIAAFVTALLTVFTGSGASCPHIFYPLVPVVTCVVLFYPLLYKNIPGKRLMRMLLTAGCIALSISILYALASIFGYNGGIFTRVIDIILTLAVAGGCIPLLMVLVQKGLAHKYCPKCGRYSAKHEHTRDLVKVLGVSAPSENYVFDHESRRTDFSGRTTVTRYYRTIQTEACEFGIITPFYRCDQCGTEFEGFTEDFG